VVVLVSALSSIGTVTVNRGVFVACSSGVGYSKGSTLSSTSATSSEIGSEGRVSEVREEVVVG
jgi:hypothetical protein